MCIRDRAGAADRMNGAMGAGFGGAPGTDRDGAGTGSGKAGADSPPAETVILPKAQYEDLMMIKKELGKIARQMGGSVRLALQEAVPRPVSYTHLDVYKRQALASFVFIYSEFKLDTTLRSYKSMTAQLYLRFPLDSLI